MNYNKIVDLLDLVIDSYLDKWEPIGSKFLHSLEETEYAPSTLRKYLNMLEKEGFLYQPYNSAWRIPTLKWMSQYIEEIIQKIEEFEDPIIFDINFTRNSLRFLVETLWNYVDGTVVGFLKDDEYYFLGINNLFKDKSLDEYWEIRPIIKFIEDKKIIEFLNKKIIKKNNLYYTFINDQETVISCIYVKVEVNWYDCILSILWPVRLNYKKNLWILKKFLQTYSYA